MKRIINKKLSFMLMLGAVGYVSMVGTSAAQADEVTDNARNTACGMYNSLSLGDQADAIKNSLQTSTQIPTPGVVNLGLALARIGCFGVQNNQRSLADVLGGLGAQPNQGNPQAGIQGLPNIPGVANIPALPSLPQLPPVGNTSQPSGNVMDSLNRLRSVLPGATPESPLSLPSVPNLTNLIPAASPTPAVHNPLIIPYT